MVKVGSEGKEVSISFWNAFDKVRTKVAKDEDWACLSIQADNPEVCEKVLVKLIEDLKEALIQVRIQSVMQKKVEEIEKEVRNGAPASLAG